MAKHRVTVVFNGGYKSFDLHFDDAEFMLFCEAVSADKGWFTIGTPSPDKANLTINLRSIDYMYHYVEQAVPPST